VRIIVDTVYHVSACNGLKFLETANFSNNNLRFLMFQKVL
jgi:hypothetical protein